MIRMSAALAARDDRRLRAAMHAAVAAGLAEEAEEVLVQSYLFVGYPIALTALAAWREETGLSAPRPREGTWSEWLQRGERVLAAVYGGEDQRLRVNVRALHPDLELWMVAEGYGKVLGREGLDLPWRELAIVALLAVMEVPRQLYSHLRGALQVGASEAAIEETLALAMELVTERERKEAVQRVWEQVRQRSPTSASSANTTNEGGAPKGDSGLVR